MDKNKLLSNLPSVDQVLLNPQVEELLEFYPRVIVVDAIRTEIGRLRSKLLSMAEKYILQYQYNETQLAESVAHTAQELYALSCRKVINGTGTILHTNLGRAILSSAIQEDINQVLYGYANLEYDLKNGKRGSRYDHLVPLLKRLTGAQDAMAVNNNAAAVMLALNTLCEGGEAVVSRGELVEVGGSFRIPDIMALSGAKLREVGTTNKTHLSDYEMAINEHTRAILKVHTSNYKVMGFTESVSIRELAPLAKKWRIPIIEDLGSGMLLDLSPYGLPYEPTVQDSIRAGADIVTFSGDKLLGAAQAGIIVGKKDYIDGMKKNQYTRAFRIDKMNVAVLEATLRLYLDEKKALQHIPALRMITMPLAEIEERAENLYSVINSLNLPLHCTLEKCESQIGGGSMPDHTLKSCGVTIKPQHISTAELEKRLRLSSCPVIGRIEQDKFWLDLRTIQEPEVAVVVKALQEAIAQG